MDDILSVTTIRRQRGLNGGGVELWKIVFPVPILCPIELDTAQPRACNIAELVLGIGRDGPFGNDSFKVIIRGFGAPEPVSRVGIEGQLSTDDVGS